MDNKLVGKGKYIYNEIQARDKTKLMIKNLEQNLRDCELKYEDCMGVHSIQFNNVVCEQNNFEKSSVANSILSDEQRIEMQIKFLKLQLRYREDLYHSVINFYDGLDKQFLIDCFSGKFSTEGLKSKYYETNPYKKVIRLLGQAKIELL